MDEIYKKDIFRVVKKLWLAWSHCRDSSASWVDEEPIYDNGILEEGDWFSAASLRSSSIEQVIYFRIRNGEICGPEFTVSEFNVLLEKGLIVKI